MPPCKDKLTLYKWWSNSAIIQGYSRLESIGEMTAEGTKVRFLNGIFVLSLSLNIRQRSLRFSLIRSVLPLCSSPESNDLCSYGNF